MVRIAADKRPEINWEAIGKPILVTRPETSPRTVARMTYESIPAPVRAALEFADRHRAKGASISLPNEAVATEFLRLCKVAARLRNPRITISVLSSANDEGVLLFVNDFKAKPRAPKTTN